MLSLTAFSDGFEREKARRRTHDAMIRKPRAGHGIAGTFLAMTMSKCCVERERSHVIRRINDTEAAIVRRILALCAEGADLTRVTKILTAEVTPAPRPQHKGRPALWGDQQRQRGTAATTLARRDCLESDRQAF